MATTSLNRQTNFRPPTDSTEYLFRPRINALLEAAIEKPLVIVCAGAGYGKTRAVSDFTKKSKIPTMWMQLSEHDNVPSRFWESFVDMIAKASETSANELKNLGFPDTLDKTNRYFSIRDRITSEYPKFLAVLDDLHLIKNPAVLGFIEDFIQNAQANRSVILISRENPQINLTDMQIRDAIYSIQEEDLSFTENELTRYLSQQDLSVGPQVFREIYRDISGWPFLANFVTRSLKKSPGYSGYTRNAIKPNVFQLMEEVVWSAISEPLKHFLACLSLIEHLPAELIEILVAGDKRLLGEFRRQSAYIRYDTYMNAYLIHHLFLDFLHTKQDILSEDEKRGTYQAAAKWCEEKDYIVDALDYYEKVGNYDAIVSMLFDIPFFLPYDLAQHMTEVFRRVPDEMFLQVDFLAVMYLRTVIALNRGDEFASLSKYFEDKFLALPEESIIQKHTLGLIYYFQGLMRIFMSTIDERYDFDIYFAKMDEYLADVPITPGKWLANSPGPWAIGLSSGKPEAGKEYLNASVRMATYVNRCLNGILIGLDDLAMGELKFYQGKVDDAKPRFLSAAEKGRKVRQFETVHRALFYRMRSALSQGKREQAEQALEEMEALLDEKDYSQRFITYDIALGYYYYILRLPEMIPGWLKEKFSPYYHAFFPENFGNQMKARYHYMTKNFTPLLAYIDEMKQRESILYGRIEMLAIEACASYQMRDKARACAALEQAYELSSPIEIAMPFIELGKDMRTLTAAAIRDLNCGIPKAWLQTINKKASLYARYQAMVVADYEKDAGANDWVPLSARETEVLHDLYAGFSRTEIAAKRKLSLRTINMNIQNIYTKLHAKNVADIIRTAVERKLI
ncbi:MAG: LuxR C-terminal-related transcriptional regulator [Firmicutes bacterium]|nr:LuxR C-terminal-related transcriptional regulator [Bacillota bacterium]